MATFSLNDVRAHIRKHHPRCPDFAVDYFAAEVSKKRWEDARLGTAVGITIENFLRHQMTDYEQMLLVGVDRAEARRRAFIRIRAMMDSWKASTP